MDIQFWIMVATIVITLCTVVITVLANKALNKTIALIELYKKQTTDALELLGKQDNIHILTENDLEDSAKVNEFMEALLAPKPKKTRDTKRAKATKMAAKLKEEL